jgi:Flp pilus assembly protein TadG
MTPILHRQRGAVAIMVAVSMLVLLAVAGLAIDAGLAYLVKARLNAAVDSAALAGARAVTTGNNQAEQIASARAAAAGFFEANIPNNYLLSTPKLVSTNVTFNGGQAIIDVRAEAPMPVSIMQVMNFKSLMPVAAAQTIRNDLDMMLVVDTSGSLSSARATVKTSAKIFLNKFNVTQDRVGLVHFAYGAEVDNPISVSSRGFNRASMLKNIDNYVFDGGTSSVEGMWQARDQLKKIPSGSRSSMRVIVFFSDGAPTGFGSKFEFKAPLDCLVAGSIDTSRAGLNDLNSSSLAVISNNCRVLRNNVVQTRRMPDWYNARDDARELRIVPGSPRALSSDISTTAAIDRNVELAARNLSEAVAAKARDDGIFVFTLGMGAALKTRGDYDADTGEMILKCMANVADAPSRCYNPAKPVGMYCYAATETDLTPCFSRLASAILRISK